MSCLHKLNEYLYIVNSYKIGNTLIYYISKFVGIEWNKTEVFYFFKQQNHLQL